MIVCLCEGVPERRIRREIERGATTIEEVGEGCKAGTICLGCHAEIEHLLCEVTPVRVRVA